MSTRVLMLLENNTFRNDPRPQREANALVRAGYRVSVISPRPASGGKLREELNGVQVYYFPPSPEIGGFLGYLLEYGYATLIMAILSFVVLVREGFDVLHAHNPPDTFFWLAALYKLLGKKFVFDHHDLAPEMYDARSLNGSGRKDGKRGNPSVYRALEWCEKLTCRVADHVIATNNSYKAVEMQRDGVPESRITVVRNGPDLTKFHPVEPDAALRRKANFLLGYVGVMGPQDGVDYLLRALRHLVYDLNRRDFYAVIMGPGEMLSELKHLSQELEVNDFVWFTGFISFEDLLRNLSTVDICVGPDPSNPFTDRSTMIKIMEYLVMGKPIVAFDLAEHHESAADAAVYARPNDELDFARCIAALMDDPERRERMGRIGRQRIESELAWSHQEKHLLAAYTVLELLLGRKGSAATGLPRR